MHLQKMEQSKTKKKTLQQVQNIFIFDYKYLILKKDYSESMLENKLTTSHMYRTGFYFLLAQ